MNDELVELLLRAANNMPQGWDLVERLRAVAAELKEQATSAVPEGYILMPVIDWVGTDSSDPRDAYTTRINGHVIGVHSDEERARNHAWAIEAYIKDIKDISAPQQGG